MLEIGPLKTLPMPLAKAKTEKTSGTIKGSSPHTIVINWFQTAAKPKAVKPKTKLNTIRMEMLVAKPQRRKQASEEPKHEMVMTTRIGQRSER